MQSNKGVGGYAHVTYDLYDCSDSILTDADGAVVGLTDASRRAGLTVVNQLVHVYENRSFSLTLFLSESHISVHTWPENKYCALDIFLCRGDLDKTEEFILSFLKPRTKFKASLVRASRGPVALDHCITTRGHPGCYEVYQMQRMLLHRQTEYQLLEIAESERFGKLLFLDRDIQLSTSDEYVYHELLVHPAMQAHQRPERVLVIGGGDGGALREVLKYQTLRKAMLVDIDEQVIKYSQEYLPEISQGSFEDPRVEIVYSDAATFCTDQRFDVVVIDLTAPQGISLPAYQSLLQHIESLLHPDGMLTMHSGWWGFSVEHDYPALLLQTFPHTILKDQWVPSFGCFWSFVVAWKHDMNPMAALGRIATNTAAITSSHFKSQHFARTAFVNSQSQR